MKNGGRRIGERDSVSNSWSGCAFIRGPGDYSVPAEFALDGRRLNFDDLDLAIGRPIRVTMSDSVWRKVTDAQERVCRSLESEDLVYGVNTGFGYLCSKRVPPERVEALQQNLIISHAVGVGGPVPNDIVRLMMLLKVYALTHGVSGVSRKTLECLISLLNADILPIVPRQGSLGASGDLAPLSHMVLPMLGLGEVSIAGRIQSAGDALRERGLRPVRLGPKEGLALNNGTQFMSAYGVYLAACATRLCRYADLIAAMTIEGVKGCTYPFEARLHELRPHPGAIECADNLRRLLEDSTLLRARPAEAPVQDPYSIRCIPQVHGASRDALRHVVGVLEIEMNSVSDNPIVFDDGVIVSGGLFHGQPIALALDYLAVALAELGSISERRINLLLGGMHGLPKFLIHDSGVNSGYMLAHYTAAALASENKGLCMPASVDSIPTSLGQEDHVSMGAQSAVKCYEVLTNVETILAIEQVCAAQAIDFRAPVKPGPGARAAHGVLREHIHHADLDRLFGEDIQKSLDLLCSGKILSTVERKLGSLS